MWVTSHTSTKISNNFAKLEKNGKEGVFLTQKEGIKELRGNFLQ